MSIDIQTAYKTTITLPYGNLRKVLDWCDRNCIGEFKLEPDLLIDPGYTFYFDNERDYVAFQIFLK